MHFRFLLITFSFFLSLSFEAKSSAFSFKDYLDEVKAANPNIEASKLRALAMKHRIKPIGTWDDPFIAAGIDEKPFRGGEGEVRRYQLSQTIPFPGKLSAKSEIAEKLSEASEFDALTKSRQIKVLATQAYLQAGYNQEAIRLNHRIQKLIEETIASAKARYRTGGTTHHEWILAKLELSTLKVEAFRLERIRKTLLALMNELRGQPPEIPLEIDHTAPLKFEKTEEIVANLDEQPELRAMSSQKNMVTDELKLVKLSYAPDFVIQAMAMEPTMGDSEMKSNWGLMVGITVPLFFWRKQSELVAATTNERLATIAEIHGLQNRINTEVTDAKQQMATSLDVVKLYQEDVIPLTEIAVKNARSGYAAKTLPLGQLLEALKAQRTQELELLAAHYDVVVARTRITELLSSPPVTRFAPNRPTLFSDAMGMETSPTINMGQGMSGPTRKNAPSLDSVSPSGMGGM